MGVRVAAIVLGVLACALPPSAVARDTHVSAVLNGYSYHLPRDYYNERNVGYGLQIDAAWGDHHAMFGGGTYRDSYYTHADYLGAGYNYRIWEHAFRFSRGFMDAGLVVLVAKSAGYSKYYHVPILIAPLPWVSVGNERVAVNIMFAPAPSDNYASVLTLQFKFVII